MQFKKALMGVGAAALIFGAAVVPALAAAPNWNTTGSYVVEFTCIVGCAGTWPHDLTLVQDGSGNLTGSGGNPVGAHVYNWVLTSGTVDGNTINFTANYTSTADAVTPQTTMIVTGTIAGGTMSGTWSDNYQGGSRSGTWTTTSGTAVAIDPTPEVYIHKYIDGVHATALNANNASFPMLTSFQSSNYGTITDAPFTLSTTGWGGYGGAYEAWYVGGAPGDTYTAHEVTSGNNVVGASCAEGTPFALQGYSYGDTLAQAFSATKSATAPTFTDIRSDKYLIVWNRDCSLPPPPVVPAKEACKNDGWKTMTSPSFKNQGQCIQYAITGK